MYQNELNEKIKLHELWLNNDKNGIKLDLTNANLRCANLTNANLRYSNLRYSNLRYSNLRYSNLTNADLTNANLSNANLTGIEESLISITSLIPEGNIIGYKKVNILGSDDCAIVKLLISDYVKRSNATGRKCRSESAKVMSIEGINCEIKEDDIFCSKHNSNFRYKVGEIVLSDSFDENRWNECSNGIHWFITKIEAINYN
jgi:hypothetical protein